MKRLILFLWFFTFLSGTAMAQENKTREIILEPGYKIYSVDKSPSLVNEYSQSDSSPSVRFNIKDYSETNKYNIQLNINEYDDYDFDIYWFYKDKLRLEIAGVYLAHDLGFKENSAFTNLSQEADFIVKYRNQRAELKYKPFLYPFHVRLNAGKIEREGDIQKRFYGKASLHPSYSSFSDIFSRKAPIDHVTNSAGASVDGLLGGLNLFLAAGKITFRDGAKTTDDDILKTPQQSEENYSFRLTSNQSGRISFAVSISGKEMDNDSLDELGRKVSESSYKNSTFIFSYYPFQELKISLRASYEDFDQNNSGSLRYNGMDYAVSPAISYIRKTIMAKARYDFGRQTHLSLELKTKQSDRGISSILPEQSTRNSGTIEFSTNIKKAGVKVSQLVEKNNNPSYKNIPESTYKTGLKLDYNFSDSLGADFDAFYLYETNNEISSYFVESRTKGVNANLRYIPEETLNINFYFSAEEQSFKSDIEFGKPSSSGYFVKRTPYESKNIHMGANINKSFGKKSDIYADLFYLRGYGTYTPEIISGVTGSYSYDTSGLSGLAAVNFYQYGMLLGSRYKVSGKDTIKCELSYKDHVEKADTLLSGAIKTAFVAWERRW